MSTSEAKRVKELEKENTRLKKLVADLSLDNAILKDINSKKLLSPAKVKAAASYGANTYHVSQRQLCRALKINRTTLRYQPKTRDDESYLTGKIIYLACNYGSYGYRMVCAMLRNEGLRVNHKRAWSAYGGKKA